MSTTIKVDDKIKSLLEALKEHKRETFNQVLRRIVTEFAEEEELSQQTISNIQKSLDDIKKGRISSHKDVKRRLNLK